MDNKAKLLDQAQKFLQKGQLDKAAAEFKKVIEVDPKDLRHRLKLGEIYLKQGNKTGAIDEYSTVADSYKKDGFYLQAIAVFKQLLKLEPNAFEIYGKLADLYKRQGLVADAIAQYRIVVNYYEKAGKLKDAVLNLEQLAGLDPQNFSIRAKLADLHQKLGDKNKAQEEYASIARDLSDSGRPDDVVTLYERMLQSDPMNAFALRGIGETYLRKGKQKEALSKLELAWKAKKDDIKTLCLLAETYRALGDVKNARSSYERALKVDSVSADATKGLSDILLKEGDAAGAFKAILPIIAKSVEAKKYDEAIGILIRYKDDGVKEAKLFERLAEIYDLTGDKDKAAEVRKELEQLLSPGLGAQGWAQDSRSKPSEHQEAKIELPQEKIQQQDMIIGRRTGETAEPLIEQPTAEPVLDIELPEITAEEPLIVPEEPVQEEGPEEDPAKYLVEADVYIKYGIKDKAVEILNTALGIFPGNMEILSKLSSLGVSAAGIGETAQQEEEIHELELLEDEGIELEDVSEVVEEVHELEVVSDEEVLEGIAEEDQEYPDSKVDQDLEEAEFYIQQGLYDEARGICKRILDFHPGNDKARAALRTIDDAQSILGELPEIEEPAAEEGVFDLAAVLDEEEEKLLPSTTGLKEAEEFGFEDIFSEFKKGVDAQLEKEDSETHYNLGIAYKEMGLLDDAVREFKIASSDHKMEFDCLNLTGICMMDKGEAKAAIEVFKKGLKIKGKNDNEYASMYYELGSAYEREGMTADALSAFEEVKKISPGFREVEAKIASLGTVKEGRRARVSYV